MLGKHCVKLMSKRRVRRDYLAAADQITLPWQDVPGTRRAKRPAFFAVARAAACMALVAALGAVATGVFRTPDTTGRTGGADVSGGAAAGNNFTLTVFAADAAQASSDGTASGSELKPGVSITLPTGQYQTFDIESQIFGTIKYNSFFKVDGDDIQKVTVTTQSTSGTLIAIDIPGAKAALEKYEQALSDVVKQANGKSEAEQKKIFDVAAKQGQPIFADTIRQDRGTLLPDQSRTKEHDTSPRSLTFTAQDLHRFSISWQPGNSDEAESFTSIDLHFDVTFMDGSTQSETATLYRNADGSVTTQLKK